MKRYLIESSFYIMAEDDSQANKVCRKITKEQKSNRDNQYKVEELREAPFASMKTRVVKIETETLPNNF